MASQTQAAIIGGAVGALVGEVVADKPFVGAGLGVLLALGYRVVTGADVGADPDKKGGWGLGGGDLQGWGFGPGANDDEGNGLGGPGSGCSWWDQLLGNCGKQPEQPGDPQPGPQPGPQPPNPGEQPKPGDPNQPAPKKGPCALPAGEPSAEVVNSYFAQLEQAAALYKGNHAAYEATIPDRLRPGYATYANFKQVASSQGFGGMTPAGWLWLIETDRRWPVLDTSTPGWGDEGCILNASHGGYHVLALQGQDIAAEALE